MLFSVPPVVPPDRQLSPPAPDNGQVYGKHEKTQGHHPESENRQKSQDPAKYEPDPDYYARPARLRQMPVPGTDPEFFAHSNVLFVTQGDEKCRLVIVNQALAGKDGHNLWQKQAKSGKYRAQRRDKGLANKAVFCYRH